MAWLFLGVVLGAMAAWVGVAWCVVAGWRRR